MQWIKVYQTWKRPWGGNHRDIPKKRRQNTEYRGGAGFRFCPFPGAHKDKVRTRRQVQDFRVRLKHDTPCHLPLSGLNDYRSCGGRAAALPGKSAPAQLRHDGYWVTAGRVIFSMTWSRLKLAAFIRGGYSLKVARKSAT